MYTSGQAAAELTELHNSCSCRQTEERHQQHHTQFYWRSSKSQLQGINTEWRGKKHHLVEGIHSSTEIKYNSIKMSKTGSWREKGLRRFLQPDVTEIQQTEKLFSVHRSLLYQITAKECRCYLLFWANLSATYSTSATAALQQPERLLRPLCPSSVSPCSTSSLQG